MQWYCSATSRMSIALCWPPWQALVAAPGLCAALEIEPGQWESSETSDVDGKPGEPEVSTDCVTPEDARDPVKALAGMQDEAGGKCRMFDVKQTGNVVSVRDEMRRPEGRLDRYERDFVFENARHYTGALTVGDDSHAGSR